MVQPVDIIGDLWPNARTAKVWHFFIQHLEFKEKPKLVFSSLALIGAGVVSF